MNWLSLAIEFVVAFLGTLVVIAGKGLAARKSDADAGAAQQRSATEAAAAQAAREAQEVADDLAHRPSDDLRRQSDEWLR